MSAQTAPMAELVPFRFEITGRTIADTPAATMRRLQQFITTDLPPGSRYRWWDEYPTDLTVIAGEMPQPQVTALQALAMGHDVDAVLDLLEGREDRP